VRVSLFITCLSISFGAQSVSAPLKCFAALAAKCSSTSGNLLRATGFIPAIAAKPVSWAERFVRTFEESDAEFIVSPSAHARLWSITSPNFSQTNLIAPASRGGG